MGIIVWVGGGGVYIFLNRKIGKEMIVKQKRSRWEIQQWKRDDEIRTDVLQKKGGARPKEKKNKIRCRNNNQKINKI